MKESRLLSIALASCAILSLSPTTGSGAQERILASEEDTALSIRFAKEHSHPIPRREAYAERLMLQYPVLVEQLLNKVRVKRLPAGSTLEIYDERPSLTPGTTNVRARHVHKGIVVVGEEVILGVRDGLAINSVLRLTREMPTVTTSWTPAAAELAAGRKAEDYGTNPEATCSLVLLRANSRPWEKPVLRFQCKVRVDSPRAYYEVVLDADSLSVVHARNTTLEVFVPTTAIGDTAYDLSDVVFDAEVDDISGIHQMSSDRLRTWDGQGRTDFVDSVPIRSNTSEFTGVIEELGVSAHWGAERAFDTHLSRLGLDTVDLMRHQAQRSQFDNLVNWGKSTAHFIYQEARTEFGFLDNEHFTHIDVIGHEYGHAVSLYSLPPAILLTSLDHSEYGAIIESIADILAELTERDAMPDNDWILGDNLPTEFKKKRDLRNPMNSIPPQPDVYLKGNWIDLASNEDRGGVHINDSIGNLWFTRMALGASPDVNSEGTPYSVEAIGIETATKIVFQSIVEKLALLGTYPDLRIGSEAAIEEMCGPFSLEAETSDAAWDSVEVPTTTPAMSDTISPQNGAVNVSPWSARLAWEARGQTGWELQISSTADFINPAIYVATSMGIENGVSSGYADVYLEADTEYFWRVRWADLGDPDLECWRPTRMFITADNVPQPLAPNGTMEHPWELPFTYSPIEGASHYEIDVHKYRSDSIFSKPQRVPAELEMIGQRVGRATGEITVLKKERLQWRVRSVFEQAGAPDFISAWSSFVNFNTLDPKPTTTSPIHNSIQYPWNLEYDWMELQGAQIYEGQIRRTNSSAVIDDFRVRTPYLSAKRSWSHSGDHEQRWRLKALGPPLGHAQSPDPEDTAEESQWSSESTYSLDFDATRVHITYPQWDPVVKGCFEINGSSPQVEFGAIPDATEIVFEYTKLRDQNSGAMPPSFAWNFADVAETVTIPGQQAQGSGGPTAQLPGGVGYVVRARAKGPGGVWGANADVSDLGKYSLRPTKPSVLNLAMFNGWTPGWLHMLWETEWAPRALYRVEIFENGACSGPPDSVHNLFGNVNGGSAFEVNKGAGSFSWKVRPAWDGICSITGIQWSGCNAQSVAAPPPPPPPGSVIALWGSALVDGWFPVPTGRVYIIFSVVNGATEYKILKRDEGASAYQKVTRGAPWLVNEKLILKDAMCVQYPSDPYCSPSPEPFLPNLLIAVWEVALPAPTVQEFSVKACNANGCSAPAAPWAQ